MLNHPHSVVEKLLKLIREQRERLFYEIRYCEAPEREFESDEDYKYRENWNEKELKEWNKETEAIIADCFKEN